jgi:hypothetical protein
MAQDQDKIVTHTPGPWHVDSLGKVRCAAEDGKGFIADPGDGRYAGSIPRNDEISLANARLIAAALEEVLDAYVSDWNEARASDDSSLRRARAAIAKVRAEA